MDPCVFSLAKPVRAGQSGMSHSGERFRNNETISGKHIEGFSYVPGGCLLTSWRSSSISDIDVCQAAECKASPMCQVSGNKEQLQVVWHSQTASVRVGRNTGSTGTKLHVIIAISALCKTKCS